MSIHRIVGEVVSFAEDVQIVYLQRRIPALVKRFQKDTQILRSKKDPTERAWWFLIASGTRASLYRAELKLAQLIRRRQRRREAGV